MSIFKQHANLTGRLALGTAIALLALALVSFATQPIQAQTLTTLHLFTGSHDGEYPIGLSIDAHGNLYGATGAFSSGGSVFQMKRQGTGWILNSLHDFVAMSDGSTPGGRPVFGPDGSLYGVTEFGGTFTNQCQGGCGLVYRLSPPPTACKSATCPWVETVLYRFAGNSDGATPSGELSFDQSGNIYGTTAYGGTNSNGTVFELTPSNGGYTEQVIYRFTDTGVDGFAPVGGVTLDSSGNVFGTTEFGGATNCQDGCGTIFMLQPFNGGWAENTLYTFLGGSDGQNPVAHLLRNGTDTFYGGTSGAPFVNNGTAFEFTYSPFGMSYSVIYNFDSYGPWATLTMDTAGNLYGTTQNGGTDGNGTAFELTLEGQTWTQTVLHNFTGGTDGGGPVATLVLDANGNLYGTAEGGGMQDYGTVYEITGR
jgi:uncharacterized repeat protein (TIGR03803 family)